MLSSSRQTFSALLVFALTALVINTLCSVPSPILSATFIEDQSTFYTIGRSVCHGYIPYVDVADVKGPLAYWIFALGHWLSPDKPYGTWLLISLSTFIVLVFSYKTALLSGLKRSQALVACGMLLFFLFDAMTQDFGGRCEDFIKPAIALLIYGYAAYLKALRDSASPTARRSSLSRLAVIVGAGFAWVVLIKHNNGFAFVAAGLPVTLMEMKQGNYRQWAAAFLLPGLLAALAVAGPVLVYLWMNDALKACWDVYVLFNIETYHNIGIGANATMVTCLIARFVQETVCIPLLAVALALCCGRFFHDGRPDRRERVLLGFMVLSLYLTNLPGYSHYYCAAITPVGILAFGCIAHYIPEKLTFRMACVLFCFLGYCAALLNGSWFESSPRRFFPVVPQGVQAAEDIIATIPDAKILYRSLDQGMGKRNGVLPACRFWVRHNGYTDELLRCQNECIRNGKADFCLTVQGDDEEFERILEESGYVPVLRFNRPKYESRRRDYALPSVLWQKMGS